MSFDESELEDWEREALKGAEKRFAQSKPDIDHEFSDLPQIGLRTIRGTYFSVHDNRFPTDGIPEKYRKAVLLIHSEKNRHRVLCDHLALHWLPEFPAFIDVIDKIENIHADPDGEVDEDLAWTAESFGVDVHADCYRLGFSGPAATVFVAKDLLLPLLELVAEGLTVVGEDLDYRPSEIVTKVRDLIRRCMPQIQGDGPGPDDFV